MKSQIKIIIAFAIALLSAGIVAYILYGKRVDEWRQVADRTLKSVVSEEVVKRTGQPFYVVTDGVLSQLEARDFPKKVHLDTESGVKEYEISYFQSSHNITQSPDERFVHTYWFQEQPLDADTLGRMWNDSLREAGFRGEGVLRIEAMNVDNGGVRTSYWGDSVVVARADSLSYLSIGYVCETEAFGFLSYSWWKIYALADWGKLLLTGIVVFLFVKFVIGVMCRRAADKLGIAVDVADGCCRLSDGTIFDKERNILQKGKKTVELTAMVARLLAVLVEAEGEEVSSELLIEKMWPAHGASKEQLRKAIERLRKSLHSIDSAVVIENGWGTYRLK